MAIGLAFKAFFLVLFRRDAAIAVRAALAGRNSAVALPQEPTSTKLPKPTTTPTPAPAAPTRSEALTLLSTLQREARLLDLVGEPLDGFEDAQVGAAARQVLNDVRKSLERMFALRPLADGAEGDTLDIPKPASPVRYHIVGRNSEQASRGTITHRGWRVERCQTPSWNGNRDDAFVLSPVEIEVDG